MCNVRRIGYCFANCHSKVKAKALALINGFQNSSHLFQLQCPNLHCRSKMRTKAISGNSDSDKKP